VVRGDFVVRRQALDHELLDPLDVAVRIALGLELLVGGLARPALHLGLALPLPLLALFSDFLEGLRALALRGLAHLGHREGARGDLLHELSHLGAGLGIVPEEVRQTALSFDPLLLLLGGRRGLAGFGDRRLGHQGAWTCVTMTRSEEGSRGATASWNTVQFGTWTEVP